MQFRLHINDTNDGTLIAKELRRLADMLDGGPLNHGLRRDLHKGYALMEIQPGKYSDCADAERRLGFTLDWTETNQDHKGSLFGQVMAIVPK